MVYLSSLHYLTNIVAACLLLTGISAHGESDLTVTVGSRTDELRWDIANADGVPNIVSELRWDALKMTYFSAQLSTVIDSIVMRASFGHGEITSGKNQDSDYGADNRGCEFSRSNNDASNGTAQDLEFMVGFEFPELVWSGVQVVPFMGYGQHELNLTMTNGMQTVSNAACVPPGWGIVPPPVGPIGGLNSSYDAVWHGLLLGGEAYFDVTADVRLTAQYLRRWINYEADANWNLRPDLDHPVSFSHSATGYGNALSLAARYRIDDRIAFGVLYAYENYRTDAGSDVVFFSDGTFGSTVLNEVRWRSSRWLATLTADF